MSSRDSHEHRIAVAVDGRSVERFFLLLQQGVRIRRRVGCSVEAFLRTGLGAGPATIERIQSLMLDGRPVDDIRSAIVHDGSVLALSAAMPGLVGATLRRGGAYASFRSAITYHEAGNACPEGDGWVVLKVFNLLMAELGPALLREGVSVRSADLGRLLREHAPELAQGCGMTMDGRQTDLAALGGLRSPERVFLTVNAARE